MFVSDSRVVSFYLIGIFGILPFLLQDCLPFSLRFQLRPNKPGASISPHLRRCRAFAVVHYNCMPCVPDGGISQAQLASAANSTLAKFRL